MIEKQRKTYRKGHKTTDKMSTCESKRTGAVKSINLIVTCSTVLTWITSTFIDVSLTKHTCERKHWQEAQLSPRDRAMRRVNWNLANCHATVQKLLIPQVLTKSMVWSWRFSRRQCVMNNVHSTMTRPSFTPHVISPQRLTLETSDFVHGSALWSLSLVMSECSLSGVVRVTWAISTLWT